MASTEELRSLAQEIAYRKTSGLDRYDEWWDGEYVIVTGPSKAHQLLVAELLYIFRAPARARGLEVVPGITIGVDKRDTRTPDVAVLWPDTPLTSPAFQVTSELVVEILFPSEKSGAKLDFYAHWEVDEYVEIDLRCGSVQLLHRDGDVWKPADESKVLGFRVEPGAIVLGDERLVIPTGYLA
jgi:Uma2 family endonuclease